MESISSERKEKEGYFEVKRQRYLSHSSESDNSTKPPIDDDDENILHIEELH